jgi:tungstate transport system ATP-binding protein
MDTALTPGAPRLSLSGLIARRSGRTILDIQTLDVHDGESLAIVGPNGAGKTTLLLHLALLERPIEGVVLFEGQRTRGRELALRRRMAVVFQEPLLLDRSVLANVETGLRLRGVSAAQRHERARRWLTRFGVAHLERRSARSLSGGEAQRVSLARAFVLEPEVLLLDEPFSALDAPTRAAITDDVAAVIAETKTTTVLVTHDHDEAARLGDRVAVLIGGRVRQLGTPAEVFSAPTNEDVASFVGIETMIPAEVVGREGELVVFSVGGHTIEAIHPGTFERALICLRPEDVSLSAVGEGRQDSIRNRLTGRVTGLARAGADARIELDCGFRVRARITQRSLDELGLAPGVEAVASFKVTAVHVIPK